MFPAVLVQLFCSLFFALCQKKFPIIFCILVFLTYFSDTGVIFGYPLKLAITGKTAMLPSPGAIGDLWICLQHARDQAGAGARDAALCALFEIISSVDRQLRCPRSGTEPPIVVFTEALCERGLLYKQLHRHREAIADFSRAIDLCAADCAGKLPSYILRAYLERGLLHLLNLNTPQAIADFTCVIEHQPQLFEAYCERAMAFKELGDEHSAAADLQQARKLNPAWFDAHYPYYVPPGAHATFPDTRLAGTIGDPPRITTVGP